MQNSGNVRIKLRGMVQGMRAPFKSFAIGLSLSVVLLFLILVAQFRSFIDPFLIMLAIPMGFIGVLIMLPLTHTTLNVMSLMGILMLVGIAASNSILIVEFAHGWRQERTRSGRGHHVLPRAPAADSDDVARHHHRDGADGAQAWHGQRAVRAAGPRDHRRPDASRSLLTVFIVPAAYLLGVRHKDKNRIMTMPRPRMSSSLTFAVPHTRRCAARRRRTAACPGGARQRQPGQRRR